MTLIKSAQDRKRHPLHRYLPILLTAAVIAMSQTGCTSVNPATGQNNFTPFMSEQKEKQIGAQEHPKMLKQFGGIYDDPEIGGWVAEIGGRLVAASELPKLGFHFTVLDSPVINAFALPGGYVYISRGLLALINTEAELAGVLAHEIGHVTARHSAQRYNRAVATNLASAVLGIATGSRAVAQGAGLLGNVYLSSYSRDQEYQADKLGIRYMSRIGYAPHAQADMLSSLGRESALSRKAAGAKGDPYNDIFASHPNPADRVRRALDEAQKITARNANDYGRQRLLQMVDGLVYGDSADHGFVRGRTFAHPKLRLSFTVPDGFKLQNRATAVFAVGPNNEQIKFDLSQRGRAIRPVDHLRNVWGKNLRLQDVQTIDVNGLPGATGATRVKTKKGAADLRLVAIRFGANQFAQFVFLTPPNRTQNLATALQRTTYSFKRLSKTEAAALKPLRVRVVTVKPGDTVKSLSARMAVPDLKENRFRVMNAIGVNQELQPGEAVKLVLDQ